MIGNIPPALIFFAAALILPLINDRTRPLLLLGVPVIGMLNLWQLPPESSSLALRFLEWDLNLLRVDRLSFIFGVIFHLTSFLGFLYALHVRDPIQHIAALLYVGSALGAVFAGDLLSFFFFWEMLTISSIFLIWARRTKRALGAGFRYLMVHAAGGLCLLAGILLWIKQTGSTTFGFFGLEGNASLLIFIGMGVNCAWPVLHPWLTDAYPESTITGTVLLSAFTTKTAVYALARGFPGAEPLVWIGAVMTAFPIFYAVIENDLRRVLSYSLINQVGFMVAGIGIGTHLSINGAIAHAFNDILFKALLFMAMGAVMYRTGRILGTALGGLYRSMPLTCAFCMVGAASISAFPLFSGFVSKSMIMDAAALGGMRLIWFVLLFASAGVFHHAGIKIPYFAFFSHDQGLRPKEAPFHMLLAMGLTAFLCIFIGSYPWPLYSLLPFQDVSYDPYTPAHVLGQTQLLFFSAMAFALLLLSGIYPPEQRCVNLDVDWIYRRGGRAFYVVVTASLRWLTSWLDSLTSGLIIPRIVRLLREGADFAVILVSRILWTAMGLSVQERQRREDDLREGLKSSAMPVGLAVAFAVTLLLIIMLISPGLM